MGVVSTLIGGAMGFGVQLYSNTLQKIPLSRRTSCRFSLCHGILAEWHFLDMIILVLFAFSLLLFLLLAL